MAGCATKGREQLAQTWPGGRGRGRSCVNVAAGVKTVTGRTKRSQGSRQRRGQVNAVAGRATASHGRVDDTTTTVAKSTPKPVGQDFTLSDQFGEAEGADAGLWAPPPTVSRINGAPSSDSGAEAAARRVEKTGTPADRAPNRSGGPAREDGDGEAACPAVTTAGARRSKGPRSPTSLGSTSHGARQRRTERPRHTASR